VLVELERSQHGGDLSGLELAALVVAEQSAEE
jgi:hypothetical protein